MKNNINLLVYTPSFLIGAAMVFGFYIFLPSWKIDMISAVSASVMFSLAVVQLFEYCNVTTKLLAQQREENAALFYEMMKREKLKESFSESFLEPILSEEKEIEESTILADEKIRLYEESKNTFSEKKVLEMSDMEKLNYYLHRREKLHKITDLLSIIVIVSMGVLVLLSNFIPLHQYAIIIAATFILYTPVYLLEKNISNKISFFGDKVFYEEKKIIDELIEL